MKQKNHFKEKISIKIIGEKKFWLGIITGLLSAVIISLSFNYMRELLRISTSISNDLQILNTGELIFFNYFFASISSVLGFSVTIWFWMHHHYPTRKMGRIHSISSGLNAVLMFWVVLMLIARFGPIFSLFLYPVPIENQLFKLYDDDKLIFILLPLVIFFQNWVAIRLIYRVNKWIIISFILNIILTFILLYTTGIDQQKINNLYFSKYKTEFDFKDKEVVNSFTRYFHSKVKL